VVVLDSIITHTSAWFLDREIHQLVDGENFDELIKIRQYFPPSKFCAIWYVLGNQGHCIILLATKETLIGINNPLNISKLYFYDFFVII